MLYNSYEIEMMHKAKSEDLHRMYNRNLNKVKPINTVKTINLNHGYSFLLYKIGEILVNLGRSLQIKAT
ncbi:MAG: hypothetical protein ACPKMZ_07905 [Pleomorphochaeta sp.]